MFFECYVVANRLQRISWVNVDISQNVCNLFFICMLHNRHTKVWFLPCKSMVFGVQKGGFCIAKVWFLIFECYVVVNRSHAFRGWMWIFCGVFATLFQFASSVISRPLAAVGTDLSCPHIRKHPQNGEQKCMCGDLNIRILRCGHPFAMKRIHVFDNGKIRIWQRKNTGTMNRSLRLAVCSWEIS